MAKKLEPNLRVRQRSHSFQAFGRLLHPLRLSESVAMIKVADRGAQEVKHARPPDLKRRRESREVSLRCQRHQLALGRFKLQTGHCGFVLKDPEGSSHCVGSAGEHCIIQVRKTKLHGALCSLPQRWLQGRRKQQGPKGVTLLYAPG